MVIALPLASRWYSDQYQGLVLGIAGATSSDTVFATLFAPSSAENYGWRNVLGLVLIPLTLTFLLYLFAAKDAPFNPNISPAAKPQQQWLFKCKLLLLDADIWWFMLLLSVVLWH